MCLLPRGNAIRSVPGKVALEFEAYLKLTVPFVDAGLVGMFDAVRIMACSKDCASLASQAGTSFFIIVRTHLLSKAACACSKCR